MMWAETISFFFSFSEIVVDVNVVIVLLKPILNKKQILTNLFVLLNTCIFNSFTMR